MTRLRAIAALAVGGVIVGGGFAVAGGDDGPLAAAQHELADDDHFERASDAGAAFTRVSRHLEDAGADCDDEPSVCDDLLTAAAFARVGAVDALRCRHRDIFEFRVALRDFISSLDTDTPHAPPPNPGC